MTQPHQPLTPAAALLPTTGHTVRESTPLRPAAAATLLADGNDQREAQELPEIERLSSRCGGGEAQDSGEVVEIARTDTASTAARRGDGVRDRIRWWWMHHVSLGVSPNSRRDFLALERTYLGYVRTSVALSTTGVTLAQLFQLTGSMDSQGPVRGGFAVAVCFIIAAVLVVLLGAVRYWRQQTAMARGKVWAGGFELLLIMGLVISLCVVAFAVVVASLVEKEL